MALLIITFGLLGVAGMQAVSVGNTSTAGYRSVAALQAQSMAAAMSANPVYWQNSSVAVPTVTAVSTSGTTITAKATGGNSAYNYNGTATLNSAANATTCQSSPCTNAATLAQYDVTLWGQALFNSLPGGAGTINCTAATATVLTSCQIVITWTEKALSQNQTTGATASAQSFDFEMAVVP
jgi:type IV pilus assembly protein PilV